MTDATTTGSLLARITLAIAEAAYPDVHPDFTDAGWDRMARAALKAMSVPTDRMLSAGFDAHVKSGRLSSQAAPNLVYRAMIAAEETPCA